MDYDELIERLKNAAGGPEGIKMCQDAALAIDTLRDENERLREAIELWKNAHHQAAINFQQENRECNKALADLARVTAERDAAVSDISSALAEVEEIRRGYGVDNADADNAFANLCGNYCAKCGDNCYKEAENYRCKNYEWRGIKED